MTDIPEKTIANPKTHYGSPRAGTRHFRMQRFTGALNIGFTLFFVWLVVRLAGAERADLVAVIANPMIGLITAALIVNVCIHMRIGMDEVIEDYVTAPGRNRLLRFLNAAFASAVALVTVIAIAKIVFWG
jgi:succinate dehydrogenase / fumarate reductase membrane anchor subunit